jgi:hypothetical protein
MAENREGREEQAERKEGRGELAENTEGRLSGQRREGREA